MHRSIYISPCLTGTPDNYLKVVSPGYISILPFNEASLIDALERAKRIARRYRPIDVRMSVYAPHPAVDYPTIGEAT